MLAFSHLVQIKGVAVIGLLLLGWGVIYQIYGAKILRALRLPVLFSLIVIPPPDTVVDKFMQLMDILTLRSAALIFRLIGRQAVVAYEQINFSANGYVLDYQGHAAAAGILSTSLLFSLFYAMVRRYHISRFLPLLVLTTINFLVVNLVRIIVAGLIAGNSADMGKLIGQNSYVLLAMLPLYCPPRLVHRDEFKQCGPSGHGEHAQTFPVGPRPRPRWRCPSIALGMRSRPRLNLGFGGQTLYGGVRKRV